MGSEGVNPRSGIGRTWSLFQVAGRGVSQRSEFKPSSFCLHNSRMCEENPTNKVLKDAPGGTFNAMEFFAKKNNHFAAF